MVLLAPARSLIFICPSFHWYLAIIHLPHLVLPPADGLPEAVPSERASARLTRKSIPTAAPLLPTEPLAPSIPAENETENVSATASPQANTPRPPSSSATSSLDDMVLSTSQVSLDLNMDDAPPLETAPSTTTTDAEEASVVLVTAPSTSPPNRKSPTPIPTPQPVPLSRMDDDVMDLDTTLSSSSDVANIVSEPSKNDNDVIDLEAEEDDISPRRKSLGTKKDIPRSVLVESGEPVLHTDASAS